MDISPYLWNAHDISAYGAIVTPDSPIYATAQGSEVQRSGTWPVRGAKTFNGNTLILQLFAQAGQVDGTFRDLMGLWFNEETDEEPVFAIKDKANSNKIWYVNAECLGLFDPLNGSIKVMLHVSDPIWKSNTLQTNTKALTASGQTLAIVVGGNRIARPKYSLKPTTPRTGGYGYKRYIAIANQTNAVYQDALIVTGGNFNTATLVAGGKMQSTGYDLRIQKDGQQIARWFGGGGINTTTTRPTCNLSLPPQLVLTLSGTLSNVGAISSIPCKVTNANKAALRRLAAQNNRVIAISLGGASEEIFTFTSVTVATCTINGTTRAQRFSTNKSQVDGATIRHIPFEMYMLYGNSAANDPAVDDAFKPMFDLTNTTTTSRVYTDYLDTANPNRLGQWVASILKNVGGQCKIYKANHITQANPASEMGAYIQAYLSGATPRSGQGQLHWTLTHPAGITSVTVSGEKFRRHAGTGWPAVASLQKFDGAQWILHANEATPAAANTWEALTTVTGALALGASYKTIGFFFEGSVAAINTASVLTHAAIEFDSITLALDSTYTPIISFGSEQVNEWQEFKIANSTTGQYMQFETPGDVNNTVLVDTKTLEAYVVETNERFSIDLDDDSRAEWLALDPASGSGTNNIVVTQTGLNACTLTVVHEERNN